MKTREHISRPADLDDLPSPHQRYPVAGLPDKVHVLGEFDERLIYLVTGVQDRVLHVLFCDGMSGNGVILKG